MGMGRAMTSISVTTSEIADALCNIEVLVQVAFSTIVLAQYAEMSAPQMNRSANKKAIVQLTRMKIMTQVIRLNVAAAVFVKIRW